MENKETICPVCEKYYFEFPDDYDICPVCGWENDGVQRNDPNYWGGANKLSVNESKAVYSLLQNEATKDLVAAIVARHKDRTREITLKYMHIDHRTEEGKKCFQEYAEAHQKLVLELGNLQDNQ